MTSSHERYRDALTALAALDRSEAILPCVPEAGERRGWWTSERTWRRMYERFTPDAEAFAEIVFASETRPQALCRIEISERRRDECGNARDVCQVDAEIGWARVTRFPFDPDLPGLATIFTGFTGAAGATVVRYHPGRRCTLRTVYGDRTVFAKVYASRAGARVLRDLVALRHAARAGALRVAIAEPLAWDARTRTLWQAALAGRPATEGLRGHHGDDLAQRMGTAAASLTRATVEPSEVLDADAALARSRRHARELAVRVPRLSDVSIAIVDRLVDIHAQWPSRDLRPIHGAPHPGQWLDTGSGIGLIDFDRFSRGDPEMDAGVVLGDFDALGDSDVPPARLAAAFLDAYRAAGVALRDPLVHAYRAHQQLARALRAAQAIRPDGDLRAEMRLATAERTLTGTVPA